ncbi:MAG TPA: D-alanyl-D-alanine carboxypeptidase [Gillisia sp.]|nr:D-alanyl-D-alanine carboxypeptidase [Gillisia sp.]
MKKNPLKLFPSASLLMIFVALILSSCSTTNKINATFNKAEAFKQGFSGLTVYDPSENKMIYERYSNKYFIPASNIKLLTFYAGLKILGDSIPALKYVVKNDSLIFWGTGDPSFLYPDLPESKVYQFLKNSKEKLYYLPPVFTEAYFGPGWAWDDYNSYYSVERSAFPIYGNYVKFDFIPGLDIPKSSPPFFKEHMVMEPDASQEIIRDPTANIFRLKTFIGKEGFIQIVPFKYSPELFVKLLADTIKKPVEIIRQKTEGFSNIKTLYSLPADSLYKTMLQQSDNFIAEQILFMVSGKISDSLKTDLAIDYIKEIFLKDLPDEPFWVDGSGLSRYNLVTPRSMVKLLDKISREVPQERLFKLMATGGKSGTIKNSYVADEPYIFAKTGSLRNNHSLSGYLKVRSGKVLIFSFMNNNYTVPSSEIKKQMELILRKIYKKY